MKPEDMLNMTDEDAALDDEIAGAEEAEGALYEELAPKGEFSKKAMGMLSKAVNKLTGLFDVDKYPVLTEDAQVFPADFTRLLAMVSDASMAADESDMLSGDYAFTLEDIVDDNTITLIAGKLDALSKDKEFKKFLKQPPEEAEVIEEVVDDNVEPTDDEIDQLFGDRI